MKHLLQQLRISFGLDQAGDSPAAASTDLECSSPVEQIDRQLRAGVRPPPEPPAGLHASIMNTVRSQAKAEPSLSRGWPVGWAAASASVALLAGGLLFLQWSGPLPLSPAGLVSSADPADAWSMLSQATVQGASAMAAPLETELDNLARDVQRTTKFLLASLP